MGRVGRAHGVRGAVVVDPHTDDPAHRFSPGSEVFLEDGTRLVVRRYEATDRAPVVTFHGIDNRRQAEAMRGEALFIDPADRRPLAEEEYWPDDLVDLTVVDINGSTLGNVAAVETGPSQDRMIVATDGGQFVVPLVAALVPVVDVAGGKVVVNLPPGYVDDLKE